MHAYENIKIFTGNSNPDFVATVCQELRLPMGKSTVKAPVEKGTVYGKVELFIKNDQKIGEVELVAGESVERSEIVAAWAAFSRFLGSPWFYGTVIALILLLVVYIVLKVKGLA